MATERPMEDRLGGALARALADDSRIWADPDRLRAVLMGLSPGHQAYRQALVAAAEEGIVQALLDAPGAAEIRLLSTRLQTRTGMDRTFADGAIRLWSSALGLTFDPEALEPPVPEPPVAPALSPVSAAPTEGRRISWPVVGALCVLSLVLAVLLFQKGVFPRPKPEAKPDTKAETKPDTKPAPSHWLSQEGNLERLKTIFVGTRSLAGKPPEVFSLQIRSLRPEGGQIKFEYALNSRGMRRDNLGTVLPLQGRLEIPDLGSGNCFLERDHLVIAIQGATPQDSWELRETP